MDYRSQVVVSFYNELIRLVKVCGMNKSIRYLLSLVRDYDITIAAEPLRIELAKNNIKATSDQICELIVNLNASDDCSEDVVNDIEMLSAQRPDVVLRVLIDQILSDRAIPTQAIIDRISDISSVRKRYA